MQSVRDDSISVLLYIGSCLNLNFGIKPFRWPGLILFSAYIATKSLVKISIAYHILNPMYAHTKFDTSQTMPLYLKAIGSSAF